MFVIRDGRAVEQKINPGQEIDGWMEVPREAVSARRTGRHQRARTNWSRDAGAKTGGSARAPSQS